MTVKRFCIVLFVGLPGATARLSFTKTLHQSLNVKYWNLGKIMWKTPTRESLSTLIMQGLTDAELAGYHGCSIRLIQAFLEEFGLKNNIRQVKPKQVFKGEVGNTIEQHLAPEKKYRMRVCLDCQLPFASDGIHNRICDRCKRSNEHRHLPRGYEGTGTG
jgi:hypothetical protein